MVTVIHPSRGRPQKALSAFQNWTGKATDKNIQWILSLDADDTTLSQYRNLFTRLVVNYGQADAPKPHTAEMYVGQNKNLVQAVNAVIPYIKGDLVVVVSDDFDCPQKWDEDLELAWTFGKTNNENSPNDAAIYINDGITFGRKCMTLPILSKSLIDKLGYIYYPEYNGMFVDDDLYQTCEKLGVIITKDILFPHNHWVNGKAPKDPTYMRHNTKESWQHGQALLAKRQERNFDLAI